MREGLTRDSDTRRMAETQSGSGQSPSGAGRNGATPSFLSSDWREAMMKDELLIRAVVALERIAGALAGQQQAPAPPDEVLVQDLNAGMSLRTVAKKHGIGVGKVRGARARAHAKETNND